MKSIFTLSSLIIEIYTLINISYGSCNLNEYEHLKSTVSISHSYTPYNQTANHLEYDQILPKNITKSKKNQFSRTCNLIESIDKLNNQIEIIRTKFNIIDDDNVNINDELLPQICKAEYLLNQLKDFKSSFVDNNNVIDRNNKKEYQQLKKFCRQLGDALDILKNINNVLKTKVEELEKSFPSYSKRAYIKAAKVLTIFTEWQNSENCNPAEKTYQEDFLLKSLDKNDEIKFFMFICPPTNFQSLSSKQPEEYLQLSLKNSLVSKQLPALGALFDNLNKLDIQTSLVAFIGDSDEEDYIWPTLGRPDFNKEELDKRRHLLKNLALIYLTENIKTSVKVHSLALDFSHCARNIYDEICCKTDEYFNIEDYKQEEKRIKSLFVNYYKGLSIPEPDKIKQIVTDKFATYAMHGVIADNYDPELFLIQTEFPPQLRNKMLNIKRLDNKFPALYLNNTGLLK